MIFWTTNKIFKKNDIEKNPMHNNRDKVDKTKREQMRNGFINIHLHNP